VSNRLLRLSGALKLHTNAILGARISLLRRSRVGTKSLLPVDTVAKLAKLQPHALNKLGFGVLLSRQKIDNVHRIRMQLSLDLGRVGPRRLSGGQTGLILRGNLDKGERILCPC
jgi:hypothetical protein